jgi:S-adenosylmethionine synthetase
MAQADAILQQRLLEGEGTTDDEGDEIVAPVLANVIRFIGQFAVAKNAITRYVSANVQVRAELWQVGIADIGYTQQRAGFWVVETEAMEVSRQFGGQNSEIALNLIRHPAAGRFAPVTTTDFGTRFCCRRGQGCL